MLCDSRAAPASASSPGNSGFKSLCSRRVWTVFKMRRWVEVSVTFLCALGSALALPNKAVCLLPVEEGPCRADLPRFYYNTLSQKCERFYYGGCQGNANNFHTYQECHKTCFRIPKVPPVCRLPQDQGPCRALLWRYFFNMSSLQCEPFYYGGCHGNANRFTNMASCTDYCSPRKTVPVLCLDPLDSGTCSASIPRFYYNPASQMCEEFKYSGCGGSSNNFVSRQSCMDVCQRGTKKNMIQGRVRRIRHSKKNISSYKNISHSKKSISSSSRIFPRPRHSTRARDW